MITAFVQKDIKNLKGNITLLGGLIAPFLMIAALNIVIPLINDALEQYLSWSLIPYYPLISAFIYLTAPGLLGFVYAFLILDERDAGMIRYLVVTPLGQGGYFFMRIGLPTIMGILFTMIFYGANRLYVFPFKAFLLALPLIAVEIPLFALLLTSVAKNKIQGLALAKGLTLVFDIPLFAYFLDVHNRFPFFLVPSFFITEILVNPMNYNRCLLLTTGMTYHLLIGVLLWRMFVQKNME